MPTLLCGNYIRCIAHSAIQQRRMNPPIVSCRKSYFATGNLRLSVGNKKIRGIVQKEDGGVRHNNQGIELVKQIVKYLEDIEGTAECFPYDEIQKLREAFWL